MGKPQIALRVIAPILLEHMTYFVRTFSEWSLVHASYIKQLQLTWPFCIKSNFEIKEQIVKYVLKSYVLKNVGYLSISTRFKTNGCIYTQLYNLNTLKRKQSISSNIILKKQWMCENHLIITGEYEILVDIGQVSRTIYII